MPKNKQNVVIGENVKRVRINKGLSKEALALKAELSRSTVYRIESGLITPKVETLSKLGEVLQVNWLEFVSGVEPIDYVSFRQDLSKVLENFTWRQKEFIYGLLQYVVDNIENIES